jgi:hypothetical protein
MVQTPRRAVSRNLGSPSDNLSDPQRAWPANSTDPDRWTICRHLEPHLIAAVHHAENHQTEQATASWLLDRYAAYLQYAGNPVAAPTHFERAVQLHTRVATSDDPVPGVSDSVCNWA